MSSDEIDVDPNKVTPTDTEWLEADGVRVNRRTGARWYLPAEPRSKRRPLPAQVWMQMRNKGVFKKRRGDNSPYTLPSIAKRKRDRIARSGS